MRNRGILEKGPGQDCKPRDHRGAIASARIAQGPNLAKGYLTNRHHILCKKMSMSHPEFLERLFEGKKGEEQDKKDPLNYTRMRYKSARIQEVRTIDVVSVSHTGNR